jgi:hypothetical protein
MRLLAEALLARLEGCDAKLGHFGTIPMDFE